jgi:hypothetical protein
MKKLLLILFITLSFNSFSQGMIQVDSSRLIVQALDSNNKETGYISYYAASDRYTTRGTVKHAVKKMYDFILMELELSSVTMLFIQALNDDGTIKDNNLFQIAVQRMRQMKSKHGL